MTRMSDTKSSAPEICPYMPLQGSQTVMTCKAAARFHSQLAGDEIEFIVKHHDI